MRGALHTASDTDKDVALVFTQVDPVFSNQTAATASLLLESAKVFDAATSLFDEASKKSDESLNRKAAEMQKNL